VFKATAIHLLYDKAQRGNTMAPRNVYSAEDTV